MDTKQVNKKLSKLMQLDVDAVRAYDQAIQNIDVATVRDNLSTFKSDHERHIEDLSAAIRRNGGTPPERKPDVKGFFIEGFTSIRSKSGTEGALKAMQGNEKLTNKTYQDALDSDLPADMRAIVKRNREDERRHLEYIEKALRDRVWEHRPTV